MAYHHGDAPAALLAAAEALLERDGAAGLSLRQVAERAGLSRQAPYNHFDNKAAMLAELVGSGFAALTERMRAAEGGDAFARLVAAADAYIAFGTERPALFRLMFGRELVDLKQFPEAQVRAEAAHAHLSRVVADLVDAPLHADAVLVAWTLVHGYTELCIEIGIEDARQRPARAALFARAVVGLTRGA